MAAHIWSIFCRKELRDPASGQVSLIDAIERVTLPLEALEKESANAGRTLDETLSKGLLFPLDCQLVTFWTRSEPASPEMITLRLRLLSPKRKELTAVQFEVSLEEHRNVRHTIRLPGLVCVGPGRYSLLVERKGRDDRFRRVASIPVEMLIEPAGPG